ncbi:MULTISPECIES: YbaY family lipoprotein [Pseudomonas]|jgi:putative lipoprotein|uniref:YbaY family lipoprotein n=1 Tax=Pseudomonas canavaninivorans TaxID=2842348 RepID=A0ABX8QAR5_PSECO|nr:MULTISPECIES: YbaY family lipoprotein [Pseudomonas]MBJ2346295.1 YbaY family lipoprotein [Pseudomonas canavaninivorans]MBL3543433.1 YbaY family lipoprotein [Pseudomonas sp. HB05]QXI52446.1 YbaY family lipoprotein [Pseudomonas alvandae]UVM71458.1 YbaY family lipoprotein [Pseudomonas canavaninivorans]
MKRFALLASMAVLAACQSATPPSATVQTLDGEVFYLQRIALPPTATLTVSLQDVSLADAAAVVIDEQRGPVEGQVPLPFKLSYDPAQVKPGHRYAVSARIEVDGQLMFITTEQHAVQLDGKDPQPLKIRVNAAR